MITLLDQISTRLQKASKAAFGAEVNGVRPGIVASTNPTFGDYQTNLALTLSRPLKQQPRSIAEQILKQVDLSDFCEPPEIAGPGFINLRVKKTYVEAELSKLKTDKRLGIPKVNSPQKVIIEYSSPNIAKEMHVGHLRGTIIGDSLANVYDFLGHKVIRVSHVGDWGTQFGMLIGYLKREFLGHPGGKNEAAVEIADLERFYKAAKAKFDADQEFQDFARSEVVRLQSGDPDSLDAWKIFCELSSKHNRDIYERLDIKGLEDRGESSYNKMLPVIVSDLEQVGLAVESEGAKCVFLEGYTNEAGQPLPVIIQKRDGGYNYATTDLAALRSRFLEEKIDRSLYVVDASQSDHFAQFFQVARRAGWLPEGKQAIHVPYGMVQGSDGKKLKTRSGETVKLKELLDEAVSRSQNELGARLEKDGRNESEEFKNSVAQAIGMGAVKYADLSLNRMTNYVFDFDKMLSLQGNTAPYMMYAYVRVRGIVRKSNEDIEKLAASGTIVLKEPHEYELGKFLLRFDETIMAVAEELFPNRICDYLFELSQKFNQFYENCPVLSEAGELRNSRLLLCDVTARTIELGLSLLGIRVPERM
jgi:arginyl-tRNA synthetase